MPSLTPPKGQIPIATVTVNGRAADCFAHPEWLRYLTQSLFVRAGGTTAPANDEISDSLALSVFNQRPPQPNSVRSGGGLQISYDVAGPTLSLDMDYVRAFLPRPVQTPPSNDAQAVICNRVFGKH